jgi:hypothetical protein
MGRVKRLRLEKYGALFVLAGTKSGLFSTKNLKSTAIYQVGNSNASCTVQCTHYSPNFLISFVSGKDKGKDCLRVVNRQLANCGR